MSRAALPILLLGLWGCAEPAPPPDQVDQPADSQVEVSSDWYRVTALPSRTFIIEEPNSSQGNVSYLLVGEDRAVLFDTGSGGIVTRNLHEEHNVFRYNHVYGCGHAYPSAVGINIDEGGGIYANNLVHDIGHSGIYARHWATETQAIERRNQEQELLIEYNEIYNCSTRVDDAGGIFIRDSNIIIRNNYIYDVITNSGDGAPGFGIYLGCETRYSLVENNIV